MTIHRTLLNDSVFTNPRDFVPERWLNTSEEELERMNNYHVPFGRGSRMCLGFKCLSQFILIGEHLEV